ncbi:unnamed protein product [Penicillium discolor]
MVRKERHSPGSVLSARINKLTTAERRRDRRIAKKYDVTPATILISYQVNRGCIVVPKSVTFSRIEENRKVVSLSKEDMDVLEGMAKTGKQQRVNTPLWGHDLGFNDWYGPGNVNAPKQ